MDPPVPIEAKSVGKTARMRLMAESLRSLGYVVHEIDAKTGTSASRQKENHLSNHSSDLAVDMNSPWRWSNSVEFTVRPTKKFLRTLRNITGIHLYKRRNSNTRKRRKRKLRARRHRRS